MLSSELWLDKDDDDDDTTLFLLLATEEETWFDVNFSEYCFTNILSLIIRPIIRLKYRLHIIDHLWYSLLQVLCIHAIAIISNYAMVILYICSIDNIFTDATLTVHMHRMIVYVSLVCLLCVTMLYLMYVFVLWLLIYPYKGYWSIHTMVFDLFMSCLLYVSMQC